MIAELFLMNGYGVFVWSAYTVCAVVLAFHLVQPGRDFSRLKKRLRRIRDA